VKCAEPTCLIHGGSQPTGLEGSAANMVPETTGDLQGQAGGHNVLAHLRITLHYIV